MTPLRLVFLIGVISSVSCGHSAVEPSQSLVGATKLPSDAEISRETVGFARGSANGLLDYELRPNGSLKVTFTPQGTGTLGQPVQSETLQISPQLAADIRGPLRRLHPEVLEGAGSTTQPIGCSPARLDHFDFAVTFLWEGPQRGISDDRIGDVILPSLQACSSPQAIEAHKIVEKAIQSLPPSKIATEFDRLNPNHHETPRS